MRNISLTSAEDTLPIPLVIPFVDFQIAWIRMRRRVTRRLIRTPAVCLSFFVRGKPVNGLLIREVNNVDLHVCWVKYT